MKTAASETRTREWTAGDAPKMRLRIEPWLTVRFSPPILIGPRRHPQHDFREARSGGMRSARARSSTLPGVRRANRLRPPTGHATVRFPTDLPTMRNGLYNTPKNENTKARQLGK